MMKLGRTVDRLNASSNTMIEESKHKPTLPLQSQSQSQLQLQSPASSDAALRYGDLHHDRLSFMANREMGQRIKVRTVPLLQALAFIPGMPQKPFIDLFILDVEGSEMDVLRSIPWPRINIYMFMIEVVENKVEINLYMDMQGYKKVHEGEIDNIYVLENLANYRI
jgi:hypothetical protein